MARGVNKVILLGNMGSDPELRQLPQGGAVANLTVATSESWTDKATGEKKEQTEWHRVVIYGKLAEIVGQYTRKGSKIYLEGKLKTRKWTDAQNVERYSTEIIADELQLLDGKPEGQAAAPQQQRQPQQQPQQQPAYQQQPQQGGYQQQRPAQQPQQPAYTGPYNQPARPGYHANGSAAPNNYQGAPQQPYNQPQQQQRPPADPNIDFDDDIPF